MKAQLALNCAAIRTNGRCNWLTVDKCPGQAKCKFFKTEQQKFEGEQHSCNLIKALGDDKAKYYSVKYYNGEAPWEGAK